MKKCIILVLITVLLVGCSDSGMKSLEEEVTEPFDVVEDISSDTGSAKPDSSGEHDTALGSKFAKIDFYFVSGTYSRNVTQNDVGMTEMFSIEKTNFIRIAKGDFEQEIFAYNYITDNFTYLYYFNDELITKTVFNVDTGAVIEDNDGFSELLVNMADDLKEYFQELINEAGITVEEIK